MLLSAFPPQTPTPATHSNYCFSPVFSPNYNKAQPHTPCTCRATTSTSAQRPLSLAATASTALGQVSFTSDDDASSHVEDSMVSSAAAIRDASTSPAEFVHRIEKGGDGSGAAKNKAMVLPSQDFQRLCLEQLDLFRRIVHPDAILSVYVRPAGSYVMDQLELRRITL